MCTDRSRRILTLLAIAVLVVIGAACSEDSTSSTSNPESPDSPAPAVIVRPDDGAAAVNPLDPVAVEIDGGTLESVTMTNDAGKIVEGIFTPDRAAWKPAVPLGYGRTYEIAVSAVGADGTRSQPMTSFSTVTPDNQTTPSHVTSGGNLLVDGATYGVGIVVVTHFDEPITDRAAAERQLRVDTTPAVEGSWYWADAQNVHWRPQSYYAPGTTVTVRADVYGVELGEGLFGQEDAMTSFTIGDAHISVADDTTKQVTVTNNGEVVRTMPTSMGKGGTEIVNGQTLSFWTQPGIYTVLDKANPVIMDSSTYGLPVNSRLGYKETINYATRISNDGIYLHELADTIWAQGNTNVSHGCLNLSPANAQWFYEFSRPGDVVEVRNTGGAPLQQWQNGDWSVPWDQWQAGSALQ
ncbi:L,D-transpeptidase [Antrihabitans spumae]|uniref:Ig-like domain-containing protein n=1 Tax=Antrihabitans spumae TaxID=3373370 RepID=A0ABW7KNQ0_9NOCA